MVASAFICNLISSFDPFSSVVYPLIHSRPFTRQIPGFDEDSFELAAHTAGKSSTGNKGIGEGDSFDSLLGEWRNVFHAR